MSDELERKERSGRSLLFAWMYFGKTHGQFKQQRQCRIRDWYEAITEAKTITYFLETTYREKM